MDITSSMVGTSAVLSFYQKISFLRKYVHYSLKGGPKISADLNYLVNTNI